MEKMSTSSQYSLFGQAIPIPACAHCHQTRSKVVRDREEIARCYPEHYPDGPQDDLICCTPDSEYRCPSCGSEELDFAMHYATAFWQAGDENVEMAHCHECGWDGEAEEAAPPVEPWSELAAAAQTQWMRGELQGIGVGSEIRPVAAAEVAA